MLLTCATIDVNRKDSSGKPPIHYASFQGHDHGAVKLLVEHKHIDLNLQNEAEEGLTAFSIAATLGRVEVVKILLGCEGIDINRSNSEGATPLNIAAS